MTDRGRLRVGRKVLYYPTDAEVTLYGAGPYSAVINLVNADGTVDLMLTIPGGSATIDKTITSATPAAITAPSPGAALADPLVTTADANAQGGAYVQADVASIRTLANANKAAINALVTEKNKDRALLVDLIARLAEYRTIVTEMKTDFGGSGAATKINVAQGAGPGQFSYFNVNNAP